MARVDAFRGLKKVIRFDIFYAILISELMFRNQGGGAWQAGRRPPDRQGGFLTE